MEGEIEWDFCVCVGWGDLRVSARCWEKGAMYAVYVASVMLLEASAPYVFQF